MLNYASSHLAAGQVTTTEENKPAGALFLKAELKSEDGRELILDDMVSGEKTTKIVFTPDTVESNPHKEDGDSVDVTIGVTHDSKIRSATTKPIILKKLQQSLPASNTNITDSYEVGTKPKAIRTGVNVREFKESLETASNTNITNSYEFDKEPKAVRTGVNVRELKEHLERQKAAWTNTSTPAPSQYPLDTSEGNGSGIL